VSAESIGLIIGIYWQKGQICWNETAMDGIRSTGLCEQYFNASDSFLFCIQRISRTKEDFGAGTGNLPKPCIAMSHGERNVCSNVFAKL
jgi:hypothetical protein